MLIPGPSSLVLEADNVAMVSYLPLNTRCALLAVGQAKCNANRDVRLVCFHVTLDPDKTIESHQTTSSILIFVIPSIAFVAALSSRRDGQVPARFAHAAAFSACAI